MKRLLLVFSMLALVACAQQAPSPPPPAAPPPPPAPPPQQTFKVYFDEGGVNLTPDARQIVTVAANAAKSGPPATPVQVTGYTDSRGSAALNQRLSQRRAQNVASALEQDGVPQNQITVSGAGESDLQSTPAESRRVEIVVGGAGPAAGAPPPPPPGPPGTPPAPGS